MLPELERRLDAAETALDQAIEHLWQARAALYDGFPGQARTHAGLFAEGLRVARDAMTAPASSFESVPPQDF